MFIICVYNTWLTARVPLTTIAFNAFGQLEWHIIFTEALPSRVKASSHLIIYGLDIR